MTDGLAVGDEVEIVPAGLTARIRGLQTHRQKRERAEPGGRLAISDVVATAAIPAALQDQAAALAGCVAGAAPLDEVRAMLCLLYTSPSPRDRTRSRMPSSA